MGEQKTKPHEGSVRTFLESVEPARRRHDGLRLYEVMCDVTGENGTMWGPSIVGFGTRHYRYASGREGDWMRVGFSPRKAQLSLYGLKDTTEGAAILPDLGTYTEGAGCVYVKRLEDIDETILRNLIARGYATGDYLA